MVRVLNDPARVLRENIAEGVVDDPRPSRASDRDTAEKRCQSWIGIGLGHVRRARVRETHRLGLVLGVMRFAGAEFGIVLRSAGFLFRLAAARRFFHVPCLRAAAAERHRHEKRKEGGKDDIEGVQNIAVLTLTFATLRLDSVAVKVGVLPPALFAESCHRCASRLP